MKYIRIIPRLDIKGPNLVKGVHLEGMRVLGKPEEFAKLYYENGSTKWNDLKNYLASIGFNLVNPPSEDHCEVLFEKPE